MKAEVTCPTRVDLAGGTLDFWPLYNFVDQCTTLNLSINIFTSAKWERRDDQKIQVDLGGVDFQEEFKNIDELLVNDDSRLLLLNKLLKYLRPQFGFSLTTRSQSPIGAGLGGSSSLIISILKAYEQLIGQQTETNRLVQLAHNLESSILRTPTGTQDYYPAATPGLNLMEYHPDGIRHSLLKTDLEFLGQRMMLVYTGQPHHSGLNNWEVLKAAINGDETVLQALRELASVAQEMRLVFEKNEWLKVQQLFDRDLQARLKLSDSFITKEIIRLGEIAKGSGASAFKVCGAGGGGCVLIWLEPQHRMSVKNALEAESFQILDALPIGSSVPC